MKKKKKNNLAYFNKWLLFLFVLLLPTQLGKHFFFDFSYISGVRVDYLAPTIYLTDILVGIIAIINIKHIYNFFKSKKILILIFLLLINILTSLSKPLAIYSFIKIIEFLIIFAVFKKVKISAKSILYALFIGALTTLFLSILQFVSKHSIQGIFYFLGERYFTFSTYGIAKATINSIAFLRPYASFSHPNSLSGFYLLIYTLILTHPMFKKSSLVKTLLLFISTILVFLSFSKIAIFTFLIINFLYILKTNKNNPCVLCKYSKIIIFLILSIVFIQAKTDPLTIQKRLELILNSWNIIKENIVFGTGIGNYLIAQKGFFSKYYVFFNQPVHNIFLLYFAEIGIIFGLLIILLFFKILKKVVLKYPFIISCVVITGFFDHYWFTLQQNILLFAVVFGLLKIKNSADS